MLFCGRKGERMKRFLLLLTVFCMAFALTGAAFADEEPMNPSLFSAGTMVKDLQTFWLANYIEIQEYMKKYPDFKCEYYSNAAGESNNDEIICISVNNPYARDVTINFYLTGDHAGMTGLQEAVFTLGVREPQDLQVILEYYWIADLFPRRAGEDRFYGTMHSLVFQNASTVMRFDLPDYNTEWDHFVTVDLWDINASRLGVG